MFEKMFIVPHNLDYILTLTLDTGLCVCACVEMFPGTSGSAQPSQVFLRVSGRDWFVTLVLESFAAMHVKQCLEFSS